MHSVRIATKVAVVALPKRTGLPDGVLKGGPEEDPPETPPGDLPEPQPVGPDQGGLVATKSAFPSHLI